MSLSSACPVCLLRVLNGAMLVRESDGDELEEGCVLCLAALAI